MIPYLDYYKNILFIKFKENYQRKQDKKVTSKRGYDKEKVEVDVFKWE